MSAELSGNEPDLEDLTVVAALAAHRDTQLLASSIRRRIDTDA